MTSEVSKWMWSAGLLLVALLATTFATQQASAQANDIQPIRCVASSDQGLREVWDRYVTGLRHGDLGRLRSVFADHGTFHVLAKTSGGGGETIAVQRFSEALPDWVANPDDKANGSIGTMTVDYNMAVIRGTLNFGATRFADVLSLYCVNGRWQIVGKLTFGRIRESR